MSRSEPTDPKLPAIELELLEDRSPQQTAGFLALRRHAFRAHYPDGTVSDGFEYDSVTRRALDAVVLVAHYIHDGERFVYLRSALRPPLKLANVGQTPLGGLWEVPAGLIEPDEQSPDGIELAARRELAEELGFLVDRMLPLGPWTFPCPGVLGERQFFFHVEVAPTLRQEPTLDGSPLEHCGLVVDVPLNQALEFCERGVIRDAKTELALRRLAELLR